MQPAALAEMLIRPRPPRLPPAPTGTYLRSGDADVAVHLRGDTGAPLRALLVHGWEGDHRDLDAIAGVLPAGMLKVMPDLPAHGASSATTLMIPEGAEALLEVDRAYGPFDLCVSHSIGTAMALVAMDRGLRARQAVFLTPPSNYVRQTTITATAAGAPAALIAAALDVLRRRCPELDSIDSPSMAPHIRVPSLVVVAGRDRVLDPNDGRVLAGALPDATLLELPEATHRSVLNDRAVMAAILSLVTTPGAADGTARARHAHQVVP
jgi:pimeloyl-ACP methyl ester carboxylesterase